MYGLVNTSLRDLLVAEYGEERWRAIQEAVEIDDDIFISNEGYPDEITYSLVGEASRQLGVDAHLLLERFGIYWVIETAAVSYPGLLTSAGGDLGEFLDYLPNFHSRVQLVYPHLEPPRFRCTRVSETSARIHYMSDRAGLSAFVIGLFRGLGQFFGVGVEILHEKRKAAGEDHDEFLVTWFSSNGR